MMVASGDLDGTWNAVRDGETIGTFTIAGTTISCKIPDLPGVSCIISYEPPRCALISVKASPSFLLILVQPIVFEPGYIATWGALPPPDTGPVVAWQKA